MLADIRYAVRSLARRPGLAITAVITMALGLGANTAIFSVVNGVLLRPLPYREPDRLVSLWLALPSRGVSFALPDYDLFCKWRARAHSFDGIAAWSSASGRLTTGAEPEHVNVLRVNANLFRLLGVRPLIGRDFAEDDDRPGAARVALIDYKFWQRRFGGNKAIAGKPLTLDDVAYTITGVLPKGFEGPLDTADMYVPLAEAPGHTAEGVAVTGCGRLRRGIPVEQANTEVNAITKSVLKERGWHIAFGAWVVGLHDFRVRDVRLTLVMLFAAVGLVLLIACANVANLLLARAASHRREVAVRTALGAGRVQLLRQFLTESVVLSAAGGILGLCLAYWSVHLLPLLAPESLPFADRISIDPRVLLFTALATVATGVMFGMAPAISVLRGRTWDALREGGRAGEGASRARFRNALVVGEVALALMLACGAALLVRSIMHLRAVQPGFNAAGVLTASIDLPRSAYPEPERRMNFYSGLLERLRNTPGIQAAGMSNQPPFGGASTSVGLYVQDAPPSSPSELPLLEQRIVDPGYFRTMQIPLKRGRLFDEHDRGAEPLAVINEAMARLWPKRDPVGRRFGDGMHWITVVGIIANVHQMTLAKPPEPQFYLPYWQAPQPAMTLLVRTASDPFQAAPALRAALRDIDKDQPVSKLAALARQIDGSVASHRLAVILLSGFAVVALLLSAVGLYGLVSYSVARRTQEIGVRVALGASPGRVRAGVLKQAAVLGIAGVLLGLAGALALTRTIQSLLFGVSAYDPVTFAAVALLLLVVTLAASYMPARRASAVDPMVALRQE